MITLKNKRDKKRFIEVTNEEWGQMNENGNAKGWIIVDGGSTPALVVKNEAEITQTVEEIIKKKKTTKKNKV